MILISYKIRWINNEGEELYSAEEVFPGFNLGSRF